MATVTSRARRRLGELGIQWPPAPPTHEYLPTAEVNGLVYVSGHAPFSEAGHQYHGRLGDTFDLDQGRAAARLAVLGCLVSVERAVGTLDAVGRIVKLNGYVHCVPGYEPLPRVTDAASELLIELFGEAGRHARTTVGVASLPGGVAVELEMVVLVRQ